MAERYVQETGISVFLTGKAGTGKTTFLRNLVANTSKRFAVVAPTGVAAINAGGVTIHSFFQLPLCPYLPDVKELITEYQMPEKYRTLRKERIRILRTLDLLVIDEISMVRADILDAMDAVLRQYRRNDRPFGGVQLLMLGDVQQLPPVVTESERPYFEQVYPSPFFFNSKALKRLPYIVIELQKIHRQSDGEFLEILNDIRSGYPSDSSLARLNTRLDPEFEPSDGERWIRLTTHNSQADSVNSAKMASLEGEEALFSAKVDGVFPENAYPAETELRLKVGAQVMFIRNDTSGEARYYNGKIAVVKSLKPDLVVEDESGQLIEVGPEEWQNVKYEIDPQDKEIKANVEGTFAQYPLRLAWAITIHKSQGLTFDHVVIDAGSAFSFGQVYVALSRCRTLEGIVLSSPITRRCTFGNHEVSLYEKGYTPASEAASSLDGCIRDFYAEKLIEAFDLEQLKIFFFRMNRVYQVNLSNSLPEDARKFAQTGGSLEEKRGFRYLDETARKFCRQIAAIMASNRDGSKDEYLRERSLKAAEFFSDSLVKLTLEITPLMKPEIGNKAVKKTFNDAAKDLLRELCLKLRVYAGIIVGGFNVEKYQSIVVESELSDDTTLRKILRQMDDLTK